jgi:dolichyl-phosphate beta-glucosyltransferase
MGLSRASKSYQRPRKTDRLFHAVHVVIIATVTHPRIAIVVPCYNEGQRLPVVEFEAFLKSHEVDFLFVDDGSRDNTRDVLASLQATRPDRVTVIHQAENRGKGEAVRQGICSALEREVEYAGFWDADLATRLDEIPEFMNVFAERPELDMVFGSRVKLLGRQVERKAARHYLGRVFATFISTMLGLPIYDSQCGAKIFRVRPNTRMLFERPFLSRWVFDVEILARYLREVGPAAAAAAIYEFPLHSWVDVGGSKLKATDFLIAFGDVLRIQRAYLRHAKR